MERDKLIKELRSKGYTVSDESGIVMVYITHEQYQSGLAYSISQEIKATGYDASFGVSEISRAKNTPTNTIEAPTDTDDYDSGIISSLEELPAL